MKRTLLPGVLIALLLALPLDAQAKPNLIFINIDDLGYADIGPFGSKLNRTPHLDRMAREGRKLTSFYAAPVCSPSRAALMTGCYPKRGLPIPHVLFPGNAVGLNQEEVSVAELLKDEDYVTGIIGKWHLGDQPEFMPGRHGFDYFFGLPYSNDMGPAGDGVKSNLGAPIRKRRRRGRGQPPLPWLRNDTVIKRVLADDQTTLVKRYTDEAVSFISKNQKKPFFLYLPHSAVHFPIYPGKAFQGKSKNGIYGDWVEEVDWSVGQVLDKVRELELEHKTMVIFTSDNGGTHRGLNTPLRGYKGSTWEGGMRVPTIAWWPGKIPAGTSTDAVTGMIDILPTLVKLAGGKVPTDRKIDGGDIWPLLSGQSGAKSPHDVFYYYRGLTLEGVRSGPWKLRAPKGEFETKGELYNLENDIDESTNLGEANPEVVKRLLALVGKMEDDLGLKGIGPGCRALGKVADAKPIIDHDGNVRAEFGGSVRSEPPN